MATKKTTVKKRQLAALSAPVASQPAGFLSSVIRGKVIPLTITFSVMLLAIKTVDIVRGSNELSRQLLAGDAQAVDKEADAAPEDKPEDKKEPASAEATATAEKPQDAKPAENADATTAAADAEVDDESGSLKKEEEAPKTNAELKKEAEEKSQRPRSFEEKDKKNQFSQVEVDILQTLSARREELAKWEEDVKTKERMLDATELRLNKKIDETKKLEETVKGLLEEYKQQEDAKIRSLVKIYENMKPKDAARIFDELEMPILVLVVDAMSERKVSPILANMNPLNAKKLTMELAEDRKLKEDSEKKLNTMSQ